MAALVAILSWLRGGQPAWLELEGGSAVGAAVAAPPVGLSSLLPDPGLFLSTGQCPECRQGFGGVTLASVPPPLLTHLLPCPQPSPFPTFSVTAQYLPGGVAFF